MADFIRATTVPAGRPPASGVPGGAGRPAVLAMGMVAYFGLAISLDHR
jgi:hypothetical protein